MKQINLKNHEVLDLLHFMPFEKRLPQDLELEWGFGSLKGRIKVKRNGKEVNCLHRRGGKIVTKSLTQKDANGKEVEVKRLREFSGGTWQTDNDFKSGCCRTFDTIEHALFAICRCGVN